MKYKRISAIILATVIVGANVSGAITFTGTKDYIDFLLSKDKPYITSTEVETVISPGILFEFTKGFNEYRTQDFSVYSDDFIYELGMYFIDQFSYKVDQSDPTELVRIRRGNCNALSQLYKEVLLYYGREDYFVITGSLDDVDHMWLIIKDEDGDWVHSDMTLAISERDVKYVLRGSTDLYKIAYTPELISEQKNWFYGNYNYFYLGKLYTVEDDMLWVYSGSRRELLAKGVNKLALSNGKIFAYVGSDACSITDKYLVRIRDSRKYIHNKWEGSEK